MITPENRTMQELSKRFRALGITKTILGAKYSSHQAFAPPSTPHADPVTKPASSLNKKDTTSAIS